MEYCKRETREINICGSIWRAAEHWRFAILSAVVFAALFGSIRYINDYRMLQGGSQDTQLEEASVSDIQEEIEALSGIERINVKAAAYLVDTLEERTSYANHASIMKLDAGNVDRIILRYAARSDENTNELLELYGNCVFLDDAQELIVKASNGTMAAEDVEDMISVEWGRNIQSSKDNVVVNLEDSPVIEFIIRGTDKESASSVAEAVKQIISEYTADVQEIYGEHELLFLSESYVQGRDESVQELQTTVYSDISSLNTGIVTYKNNMEQEEQQLLDEYGAALVRERGEVSESAFETDRNETISINEKWVILGIFVGIFFFVMLEALWWVAGGKLNSVDEWQHNINIRILGTVEKRKTHKIFPFIDRWVYQIKNRNKKILSKEQEVQFIASRTVLTAQKEQISKIYLAGTESEHFSENPLISDLAGKLAQDEIMLVVGNDIGYDSQALTEMAVVGSVIFWEEAGVSKYQEIVRNVKICKEQQVKILGAIIVSE